MKSIFYESLGNDFPYTQKLNGAHQLLVCVDEVNRLGDDINNIQKHLEAIIDTSREVGLEANTENLSMC